MSRPIGSKNKPKAIVTDSYAQAFTGAGTRSDRSTTTRASYRGLMQESELAMLYMGDGFAKKIVDLPAEDMTRAGVDLEEMDDANKSKILTRYEELDILKHAAEAIRWSRLYGGAVWVLGANDGGALDSELNPNNIREIEFIRVYDRWDAQVEQRNQYPTSKFYGQPEFWRISPQTGGVPYLVHRSRIQIFDGEPLPAKKRQENLGWGASCLQTCVDQLTRLGMGHQWANMLLERAQQAVHGIPGLSQLLSQPQGEKNIAKRVDVVDMVRGTLNTVVIDALETYDIKSPGVTNGVTDLLDRFAEAVSGVCGIPVYKLMERSSSGLNGNSEANESSWEQRVAAMQGDRLHKQMDWITTLLCWEQLGNDGGSYKLKFNPLSVPSEKEEAETEKIKADTAKAKMETASGYVNIASLDPNEVRAMISEEYEVDGDLVAPPPPIEKNA